MSIILDLLLFVGLAMCAFACFCIGWLWRNEQAKRDNLDLIALRDAILDARSWGQGILRVRLEYVSPDDVWLKSPRDKKV